MDDIIANQLRKDLRKLSNLCCLRANALLRKKSKTKEDLEEAEAYAHMNSGILQASAIIDGYLQNYKFKIKN